MTLAEDIHVGDTVTIKPSWTVKEDHHNQVKPEPATVEYIHPAGRYATVRLACGATDTIPLTRADSLASLVDRMDDGIGCANKPLRNQLKCLHVSYGDISVAMGRYPKWLSNHLGYVLPMEEQVEILRVAEQIAASRKSPRAQTKTLRGRRQRKVWSSFAPYYTMKGAKNQMKKSEIVEQLQAMAKDQREFCDNISDGSQCRANAERGYTALEEAIRQMETPSDRCLANEVLILAGLVLGLVGIVSALSGTVLCWMGDLDKAGQLVPYIVAPMVLSLLAFAGVRK